VKQFNLDPERGLHYLEEAGFFTHTPQGVARFLFRQERLSKKQIGENQREQLWVGRGGRGGCFGPNGYREAKT
jgi:hypothetical protein